MPRWLKILFAAALMVALAYSVDFGELRAHLTHLDWPVAVVALVAIVLEMPVNAAKWFWSLRLHDQHFPWRYLFRIACMGYFFSNFLPSGIGGDVYRVYRTWPRQGDKSVAVSAVIVERLVGLAVMLINGAVGALLLLEHVVARSYVTLAAAGIIIGLIALPVLLMLQRRGVLSRRVPKLAAIETTLQRILQLRAEWLALLAASLGFQVLAAAAVLFCFQAVGAPIEVPEALLITAAAGIASVLPISISGLGVVEGSIAGMAVALGASYEGGVVAALLLRVLALLVSALCGLFCFVDDGEPLPARA
ncbi:MAG: lysylphosphatidylglycerol synthase transmembrane domain-containing protein [Steroidobacteraceae bacterium]